MMIVEPNTDWILKNFISLDVERQIKFKSFLGFLIYRQWKDGQGYCCNA